MEGEQMTSNEEATIEIWKLDLERLLWSYHENGRPDGKTGVIGNPKTIEEFVIGLLHSQKERVVEIEEKYHELIMAVGNKYPGETRHQTALRYIKQAEEGDSVAKVSDLKTKIEEEI